jgi:chloramphenicol-sensitive protein RarD
MNAPGERTSGLLAAVLAYLIWGFMPLYFLLIDPKVSMWEIVLHRVIWAAVVLFIFTVVSRRTKRLVETLTNPRRLAALAASATVIAVNWGVFIWAVTHNHVLESSLGYYISPLLSVLMGCLFLRERLRPLQFLAVGIAALGVLILVFAAGRPPWVALTLATAFGMYGLIRKQVPVDSSTGLLVETLLLMPLALAWLGWLYLHHQASFLLVDRPLDLLLIGAGALTVCPLVLFAFAARRLRLGTVGLIMYIAPTTQLITGVLLLGEPFTRMERITFGHIWLGLLIFSLDSLLAQRQLSRQPAAAPQR